MHHFLNKGLAQVSEYLAVLLFAIYILRIISSRGFKNKLENNQFIKDNIINREAIKNNSIIKEIIKFDPIKKINRLLRKCHRPMGMLILFTGLIHGINSKQPVLSLNLGTATWVVSVLVGLSYIFKKKLSKIKPWIYIHRGLAMIFVILLILHINI